MRNPKNNKEADELYQKLFIPKSCPCGEIPLSFDLRKEIENIKNHKV
jgi:hypothetical protein